MANLETLELTIQGNSTGAKKGIDDLVTSLSSLAKAVGKAVGGLIRLNAELTKLKGIGAIKLPNVSGKSGASAATRGARRKSTPVAHNIAESFAKSQDRTSLTRMKMAGTVSALGQELGKPNASQTRLAQLSEQYQRLENQLNNTTNAMGDAANASKSFGDRVSSAFSKINRVASTMVTRMAIKALIKNFQEAWKAAYNFSKKMGGDFSKNIDKVRGALGNMATNIVRAFSPLMNIIAPIFSVMATGINYLTQAIKSLLEMLGLSNELLGSTAEEVASASESSKKASKEVLAGFDELNVISSSSSGGSSGGGSDSPFSGKLKEEIASIKILIAESMLAVGLILAFAGHPAVGIALAAVGAATIAGTIALQWGTLPDKVKEEIVTIMTAASSALLAIGAIIAFACPGKRALGIALMAAGAVNLAAAVTLSWNLDKTVKKKIGNIAGFTGAGLVAIGAVLAFSGANVPLGVGMMAAGGVSLASAVALNWDEVKNTIVNAFKYVKEKVSALWGNVKKAIGDAWDKYMQWTGVKWSDLSAAWSTIKNNFVSYWGSIKQGVSDAWESVKKWVTTTWLKFSVGWNNVKKNFKDTWEKIQGFVSNAYTSVSEWIGTTWTNFSTSWDNIKQNMSTCWNTIQQNVVNAYTKVREWITTTWSKFSSRWDNIKTNFGTLWSNIQESVSDAYTAVTEWINTTWENFRVEWSNIKVCLKDVWRVVSDAVTGAWDNVKTWITSTWDKVFKKPWETIKTKLSGVWDDIKDKVSGALEGVAEWYNEKKNSAIDKLKSAWKSVKEWFETSITKPIGNFFKSTVNVIIDAMNWLIDKLNSLGHIKWDAVKVLGIEIIPEVDVKLFEIPKITKLKYDANGQYDIPNGQLFIANEAGPELIGTMDGHTTVANQEQIIEGIRRGVADGQAEQNALLRRQNEILIGILNKEGTFNFRANSAFGRVAKQSIDLYDNAVGV